MPCNYKNYPKNWKTEIRPAILEREGHKCKFCNVPDRSIVCRGMWNGVPAYQDEDGYIFSAQNGERIGEAYVGEVWTEQHGGVVKIILTIAHIDHDLGNNDYSNLAALCQRCHYRLDIEHRKANRKKNKGVQSLF